MKIAITGSIGSGKSLCSQFLREYGYSVFDCDQVGKICFEKEHPAYLKILNQFDNILFEDKTIHRQKLAEIVFQDTTKRKILESIVQPYILEKMLQAMHETEEALFFAEVPLLYESGWERYFDGVLVVTAVEEWRIQRCIQNRGYSENEVKRRIQNQMSDHVQCEKATWVIENNGSILELKEKLFFWLKSIQ